MNKTNVFGLLAFAVLVAVQSGPVDAQSTTRDRLKADKCYSKDGSKEVSCEAAKAETTAAQKYPNATRVEPPFPKTKIKKDWDVLVKASTGKDSNALIAAAQTVLNHPEASANEKSESANQIAQAYLQTDKSSYQQPITYAKQAIDINGLTNNAHYQLMGVLSQMLLAEKQYDESLKYTERFSKETGVDDLTVNKTRGNALYRLKRYPEAAVSLQKAYDLDKGADPNLATMLMDSYEKSGNKAQATKIAEDVTKSVPSADPNDKSAQVKQLLVLANAKQYEKAAKVFDELYANAIE
jgi:tetratricopeptide (TPR) repeat protein